MHLLVWPGLTQKRLHNAVAMLWGCMAGRGQVVEVPFAACGLDLYIDLAGVCMLFGLLASWALHANM